MRGGGSPRGLLIVVLAVSLLAPAAAQATYPGANGRIAFDAQGGFPPRPSNHGLFDIAPNGRGKRQLYASTQDVSPTYSPDGSLLAYSCGGDICTSPPSGGFGVVVTSDPSFRDDEPVFSRDGQRIIFSGIATSGPRRNGDIYSVRLDGSGLRRVTSGPAQDGSPTVSPRNGSIVFVRNGDLYSIRPNGSLLLRLTRGGRRLFKENPDFSPNGRRIIYTQQTAALRYDTAIRTMRPNGSRKRTLLQSPGSDPSEVSWSPNGRKILFVENRGAGSGIVTAPSRGTNTQVLNGIREVYDRGGVDASSPAWQPR